jgi:hypothetical protein
MTINTPLDLITQALKRSGILAAGMTASAEDASDSFDTLNGMIAQWSQKRWLVWALDDIACVSTGAQSYPIGSGQTTGFNTPRPDRIEAAYARLLPVHNNQPFDRSLSLIESHEDYASITLKNFSTYPTSIFYDSQFPTGQLLPWPVPPAGQYGIHVLVKNQITPFTSITQQLSQQVPPEYFEALSWNLAARLRPSYGLPADPQILGLARVSLNTIRQSNVQVPTLSMPYGYPRGGRNLGGLWFGGGGNSTSGGNSAIGGPDGIGTNFTV